MKKYQPQFRIWAPLLPPKILIQFFGIKVVTCTVTALNIQALDNSRNGFLLRIPSYDGPGTYELGVATFENMATCINGPTAGDQYSSAIQGTSGSIVVSADAEGVV